MFQKIYNIRKVTKALTTPFYLPLRGTAEFGRLAIIQKSLPADPAVLPLTGICSVRVTVDDNNFWAKR